MTEYELIDAIASFNANMYNWTTLYLTALSAYLVVAYVVGARLSKLQVSIINSCFIVFSAIGVFAVGGAGMRCLEYGAEVQSLNPNRGFALTPEVLAVVISILMTGILAGLVFMWQVRHQKTE